MVYLLEKYKHTSWNLRKKSVTAKGKNLHLSYDIQKNE